MTVSWEQGRQPDSVLISLRFRKWGMRWWGWVLLKGLFQLKTPFKGPRPRQIVQYSDVTQANQWYSPTKKETERNLSFIVARPGIIVKPPSWSPCLAGSYSSWLSSWPCMWRLRQGTQSTSSFASSSTWTTTGESLSEVEPPFFCLYGLMLTLRTQHSFSATFLQEGHHFQRTNATQWLNRFQILE